MQLITIFLLFIFKSATTLNDMLVGFHLWCAFSICVYKKQSGNFESVMETDLSKKKKKQKKIGKTKMSEDESKSHIVDLVSIDKVSILTLYSTVLFFFQCWKIFTILEMHLCQRRQRIWPEKMEKSLADPVRVPRQWKTSKITVSKYHNHLTLLCHLIASILIKVYLYFKW